MHESQKSPRHKPVIVEKLALTPEEFKKNYLFKNRPVVLTNATEHWSGLGKFTPEFFKQNYPEILLTIKDRQLKLGEYIDMMLSSTAENPAPYPCKLKLTPEYGDLLNDVNPPYRHARPDRTNSKIIPRRFFSGVDTYEIFFGGPGGWFPYLHYDVLKLHALINQLYGEKQFIVYTPDQAEFMYPNPKIPWQSSVENYYAPDLEKYPLFKNAVASTITVGPGETMFIPCGWWHSARSLTPTISVAFDLLNNSNWSQFTEEIAGMSRKTKPLTALAAKTFLISEGILFNLMETLNISI